GCCGPKRSGSRRWYATPGGRRSCRARGPHEHRPDVAPLTVLGQLVLPDLSEDDLRDMDDLISLRVSAAAGRPARLAVLWLREVVDLFVARGRYVRPRPTAPGRPGPADRPSNHERAEACEAR